LSEVPTSDLVEAEVAFAAVEHPDVLILACGALAREVRLHGDVRARRDEPGHADRRRLHGLGADGGDHRPGGVVLDRHGVERLPGAHCYGFLAGNDAWDAMQEEEPGTYYLTDFLARHFDALIWRPYRFDAHPELIEMVFGNYKRLIYLAQTDNADLRARAVAAAELLGLAYEERRTGYGELQPSLVQFVTVGSGATPEQHSA